jgi:putative thioredoxin
MASSPHVVEVTDNTFQSEVVEASHDQPVVVDFWAPWCGPCKTLGPVLEGLADEGGGDWVLAKVNVDDNQQVAGSHGVRGIPAVKAFVDGEIVDEFTGAKPRAAVERWLDGFLPGESDERRKEAAELLKEGELEAAEETFRQILDDERHDTRSLVGLAAVELKRDNPDQAADHLDGVTEGRESEADGEFERIWMETEAARAGDPDELRERIEADDNDLQARYELAMTLANEGDFDAAFEQLVAVIMRDRDFGDDLGRRAMVRLFEVVGDETEQVREWRTKMGRAMY